MKYNKNKIKIKKKNQNKIVTCGTCLNSSSFRNIRRNSKVAITQWSWREKCLVYVEMLVQPRYKE
ncbi:hypothetical protein BpHYR1_042961 [Brachionus plicatilis]|uniref:Uncharacterized protein n=1 Tax=Brachionus plicatilis TaxID=10195 RepID=A0A3M7SRF3_BRAPC|nr:hypothetical protein BpHYR1_042961 [Brachionus plicatilis]